jgi:hypothetical protein
MEGKQAVTQEDAEAEVRVFCPHDPPELNRNAARVLRRIVLRLANSERHPSMSSQQGAA